MNEEEISLCDDCKNLMHFQYDREVDISCYKNHEARLYPPVEDCEDYQKNGARCRTLGEFRKFTEDWSDDTKLYMHYDTVITDPIDKVHIDHSKNRIILE